MPEKSQMLIEELNQVGLSIPRGRRRLSQVTLLSALTEAESLQLANDFKKVCVCVFHVGFGSQNPTFWPKTDPRLSNPDKPPTRTF